MMLRSLLALTLLVPAAPSFAQTLKAPFPTQSTGNVLTAPSMTAPAATPASGNVLAGTSALVAVPVAATTSAAAGNAIAGSNAIAGGNTASSVAPVVAVGAAAGVAVGAAAATPAAAAAAPAAAAAAPAAAAAAPAAAAAAPAAAAAAPAAAAAAKPAAASQSATAASTSATASQAAQAPAPAKEAAKEEEKKDEKKDRNLTSWAVVKGGYFVSRSDVGGVSLSDAGTWEVAAGWGPRFIGVELSGGSMTSTADTVKVETIPVLLTLRLQLPIFFIVTRAEGGVGAYFNTATKAGSSSDSTVAGYHAGVGVDLLVSRLIVGAEARYMWIRPNFASVGEVNLDRAVFLLSAGLRF